MNHLHKRIQTYLDVSTNLACRSNEKLKQILSEAKPMHEGIGGSSSLIVLDETPVFIKKISLTELEQKSQNFMSTANIFDLPLCYQYGVGSAGFGAWRELATHIMTTNWVISGECASFPIMYHWRILPTQPKELNIAYWGEIENYCKYWENSSAILKRTEDLNKSDTNIVLFLEYIPQNLHKWLSDQIIKGGNIAEPAVEFVDKNLKSANTYMNTHGLMHFDAHFENILTDGEFLYLSDFGLALSSRFELTKAESDFLNYHHNYDQCCTIVNLLHCIISAIFGKDKWEIRLREYIAGELGELPPSIALLIKRYAPIAFVMDDFFQKLQKKSKLTQYPAMQLEKLLMEQQFL